MKKVLTAVQSSTSKGYTRTMEYIIQHMDGNDNWITLAPIKRGRSARPYRFSTLTLAVEFLRKFYPVSLDTGRARAVQSST
jgi:hypothetical protein